jgi:hypothetical protein
VPPGDLRLETSADGALFRDTPFRLVRPGRLRISGSRLFPDPSPVAVLVFEPRVVAAARVTRQGGGWDACGVEGVGLGGETGGPGT